MNKHIYKKGLNIWNDEIGNVIKEKSIPEIITNKIGYRQN